MEEDRCHLGAVLHQVVEESVVHQQEGEEEKERSETPRRREADKNYE
jgi:hypothetical protein